MNEMSLIKTVTEKKNLYYFHIVLHLYLYCTGPNPGPYSYILNMFCLAVFSLLYGIVWFQQDNFNKSWKR